MPLAYDPEIIQVAAENLYAEAKTIVLATMVKYGFCGLLIGAIFGGYLDTKIDGGVMMVMLALVFAALGALAGRSAAKNKAFELKLRAQTALCQVQIEKNSRA